jgi:riboflavin kinase/FMN adenylyltransferase
MAPRPALVPVALDAFPPELRGGVVAVGNFDGVHRGHAALLARARDEAARLGVPALVLSFEPHPRTFFRPDAPVFRLTPQRAKARLLTALAMDAMVVAAFDRTFAAISAEDFVRDVLVGRLGLRAAVVGFDFQFGKGRAGTPELLSLEGARRGFPVAVVAPVAEPGTPPFASRAIRSALVEGRVPEANQLLGYRWFIAGEVVHGAKRGRDLGFPTANVAAAPDCQLRHGIYAVRVERADGSTHDGVASYGRRPMFDDGAPLLETFLFDFAGDLYGERIAVSLVGWIRPEQKFESLDGLLSAMRDDVGAARAILRAEGRGTDLDRAIAGIAP